MSGVSTQNRGLLIEPVLNPRDFRMAGVSAAERRILRADGNYLDFLPQVEYQIGTYFDTMACVTFSALNCLEIIQRVKGRSDNFSDRFTAKISGTTERGNYLSSVAEAIRTQGVVEEESYPYPRTQRTPPFLWGDYYKDLTPDLLMAGKRWLLDWNVTWEWVTNTPEHIMEAMAWGPIQVTVWAWPKPVNGMYDDGGNINRNHAVTLVGYDVGRYWLIFDHYEATTKKLVWDYKFGTALRYSLTAKLPFNNLTPMPALTIPNDTLVQETEFSGTFGLHLDDRIILGPVDEILATWLMRNKGNVNGKTMALRKSDWDTFKKFDLKNNPL